jgi:hypothetical protein
LLTGCCHTIGWAGGRVPGAAMQRLKYAPRRRETMRTDRHNTRKWEIILGVLFVVSFLGVTLALTVRDAVAAPDWSDFAITATPAHELLQ